MSQDRTRLPAVVPLSKILPPGTEGGKEFARIVDLLLFQEAQRRGTQFTIFNDAAGDYLGLDAFGEGRLRRAGTIGYQYKFYASPLTSKQRSDVEKSLRTAGKNQKELKLKKWLLVTPTDFIESAGKADGGDVTWFQALRVKFDFDFEIEHYGHTKLQNLFIQSESLALYYYPELVRYGTKRRKTLAATRSAYDNNLRKSFGKIEFIGMSVYKEEAAHGVPIEHIYIPLSAVSETADDTNDDTPRTDPLTFLRAGAKHVVLGDPGSGKSTLLSFLALVGISKPLQKRCNAVADSRLPIRVTLRRYADELRSRPNLSLIDYIIEVIHGDFNLKAADLEFFEFNMESGNAILLFDGLDELPSPQYKKTVRDRINTLCTTYPGNTVVITSRIVGYESELRFEDGEFRHFRLGRLRLSEIETFISDWYTARIKNEVERQANVRDLIRIVAQPENVAIRDLAANPLLLTIIALVHRIDAVLPDERVVLYQKCTETLLNTWHKWKYREDEEQSKGRVERRNRRRIEAIAYWMQCRSTEVSQKRAIVPYDELKHFLAGIIEKNEKPKPDPDIADDLAEEFLAFVKRRTGLLIEVGDEKYSFVHLTFQEYLAATNLITEGEAEGVSAIWGKIATEIENPKWREVIRLLVASLKSNESKRFFIDRLLEAIDGYGQVARSLLAGGFLIDGIEPAEERSSEILQRIIAASYRANAMDDIRSIVSIARMWAAKGATNADSVIRAFDTQPKIVSEDIKIRHTLIGAAIGVPNAIAIVNQGEGGADSFPAGQMARVMFGDGSAGPFGQFEDRGWHRLELAISLLATTSSDANFLAAILAGFAIRCSKGFASQRLFEQQLVVLGVGVPGPHSDLVYNLIMTCIGEVQNPHPSLLRAIGMRKPYVMRVRIHGGKDDARSLEELWRIIDVAGLRRHTEIKELANAAFQRNVLDDGGIAAEAPTDTIIRLDRYIHVYRAREAAARRPRDLGGFWRAARSEPGFIEPLLSVFIASFELTPDAHWREALRAGPFQEVPSLIAPYFERENWRNITTAVAAGACTEDQSYFAAWLLLLDVWLYQQKGFEAEAESPMKDLADAARRSKDGPIYFARLLRGLFLGDGSDKEEFTRLMHSSEQWLRRILERSYWTSRR